MAESGNTTSTSEDLPLPGPRYDKTFVLNMSSACKIECIVDRVRLLAQRRLPPDSLSTDWFRHIASPREGEEAIGNPERAQPLPFFPFTVMLITGTAGAGKTSSIQAIAANLRCLITGTTVIASQNLSAILNRTRTAQIRTIFRAFGFNSKHVAIADRSVSQDGKIENIQNIESSESTGNTLKTSCPLKDIKKQQYQDLSQYWAVIADIVKGALLAEETRQNRIARLMSRETEKDLNQSSNKKSKFNRRMIRTKLRNNEMPDLCRSNIIVVDECGVLLRHMLHVIVFFYYFYNALYETQFYRDGLMPCIVCVGSPTQTEALESQYNQRTHVRDIKRGLDILSALIMDECLRKYCDIEHNWVMFINNKRCLDEEFGDLLKHIEFGLPIKEKHINYMDRFVRPPSQIRDPSYCINMTRLFLSHAEVRRFFCTLHDQLRMNDRKRVMELPVYCLIHDKNYREYSEVLYENTHENAPSCDVWFKRNLDRVMNYSQFVDHNMSDILDIEKLTDTPDDEDLRLSDEVVRPSKRAKPPETQTLLVSKITYIRDSSIGVNSKIRSCVVGYSGTFDEFVNVLQKDIFIERTPCEQSSHAYSLLTGLLYSGMYLFYTSPLVNEAMLEEFAQITLPYIAALCDDESQQNSFKAATSTGKSQSAAFYEADTGWDDLSPDESWEAQALAELEAVEKTNGCEIVSPPIRQRECEDDLETAAYHDIPFIGKKREILNQNLAKPIESEISDVELVCSTDLYSDQFFVFYQKPPAPHALPFNQIVHIYTTFKDIFLKRYQIMQKHTHGEFGKSKLVTYNRRNVKRTVDNEIVSQCGSFLGMLSYASPVNNYELEGYTYNHIPNLVNDRSHVHSRVLERGMPRLVVKDSMGFISILDFNIAKFSDSVGDKNLHICTTMDYGINSRTAMTVTKSQGISLNNVAIDFGDNPKNLKLSHIYVAISRVVDSSKLIMNLNPLRLPYERNTVITPYICQALQNQTATLIF